MKKIVKLLFVVIILTGGYYVWTTQIKTEFSNEVMINNQVNKSFAKEIHSQTVLLKNLQTGDTLIEKK